MKLQTKLLLSASLITIVGINACKKDSTEPTNTNNQNCKIETVKSNDTLAIKYFYNAAGKVAKTFNYASNGIDVSDSTTYTYSSSIVIVKNYGNGTMNNTETYYLKSNGFAEKMVRTDNQNFNDTTYYTYDSSNYLMKQVSNNIMSINTYSNKNRIKTVQYFAGTDSIVNNTEYYTDKLAPANLLGGDKDVFLGVQSKNLPKKATSLNSDGSTNIADYSWVFQNGLLIKEDVNVNQAGISFQFHASFQYLCK